MKKILLTIMPVFWPQLAPIGLGYLQRYLEGRGFSPTILDANNLFFNLADAALQKEWRKSCNAVLEENILAIIHARYARQYQEVLAWMQTFDCVGFSCFKSNINTTLAVAQALKQAKNDIALVFGGPEITRQFYKTKGRFSRSFLNAADLLIAGEGEKPLAAFVQGKSAKKIAAFDELRDLKACAFPEYRGLQLADYPKMNTLGLQFSRGCIRRCDFCSERLLYKGFRTRPVESVIAEMSFHRRHNRVENFVFFDSMINADPAKLRKLCDAMIKEFGSVKWEAQAAVRSDMQQALFEKMKQSGCYNLFIGLESGCDRTLRAMNKGFTSGEALGFFQQLKNSGLWFGISMMVGYPGETQQDFRKSLDFVIRNKALIPKIEQVNPFTYYDGTPADKEGDYRLQEASLKRLDIFVQEIKKHHFKYTNAFLGNLIEKG